MSSLRNTATGIVLVCPPRISVLQNRLPPAHPEKCSYKHLVYSLDFRLDLHFQVLEA